MVDGVERQAKRAQIYNKGVSANYQHLISTLLKYCGEDSVEDLEYYMIKQLSFTSMLEEIAEALYNNPMKHNSWEVYKI